MRKKYAYILVSLICPPKCATLSVSQVVKKCADLSVRNMLTFGLLMLWYAMVGFYSIAEGFRRFFGKIQQMELFNLAPLYLRSSEVQGC